MNYEYESEAVKEAVTVVKLFVYQKDQDAKTCRCLSCKTDAEDRIEWLFNSGDWRFGKKVIQKSNKDIEVDDLGGEEFA